MNDLKGKDKLIHHPECPFQIQELSHPTSGIEADLKDEDSIHKYRINKQSLILNQTNIGFTQLKVRAPRRRPTNHPGHYNIDDSPPVDIAELDCILDFGGAEMFFLQLLHDISVCFLDFF